MEGRRNRVHAALVSLSLLAMVLAASSCARKTTVENVDTTAAPGAAAQVITDANIGAIAMAANDADIDNGKQAQSKSKNARVKEFARMMIRDHGASNDSIKALAKRLNLTPEENETSRQVKAGQDSIRATLKDKTGADFDRAYIDNEVTFHEQVLQAIDNDLLPNAHDPDLKRLVQDTRAVVSSHLDRSKQIQSQMTSSAAK